MSNDSKDLAVLKSQLPEISKQYQDDLKAIGKQSSDAVRSKALQALESDGPELVEIMKVLKELIHADKQQVTYDTLFGQFVYSDPLADNAVRLKAVALAAQLYDAMPKQDKGDVYDTDITINIVRGYGDLEDCKKGEGG